MLRKLRILFLLLAFIWCPHVSFGQGICGMGGLTGQDEYVIGSTAQFTWWNDSGKLITLNSYWVTGPAPSSQIIYGPIPIGISIPNGSSYSSIKVPLSSISFQVGKYYVVHVDGWDSTGMWYHNSCTFKVVSQQGGGNNGRGSGNGGGTRINIDLGSLLAVLLASQNQQGQQNPANPGSSTTQGTATLLISVLDNAQKPVSNATVIVFKEGVELISILKNEAPKDSYVLAQTKRDDTGKIIARLKVPAGKWNVIALKPDEDNKYWVSETKEGLTFYLGFTYEITLVLEMRISPES